MHSTPENNIAYHCTQKICQEGNAQKNAFVFLDSQMQSTFFSFQQLEEESNRFANVLQQLGFQEEEPFFLFLPKTPETFFCFLGALKAKLLVSPLFYSFGEDALLDRLSDSGATGIVTRKSYLKKLKRILPKLPRLKKILVIDILDHLSENQLSLPLLREGVPSSFEIPPTSREDPSVLHYTSGSTGKPKGVVHVHGSLALQKRTTQQVLGLESDDVYWCTADQGWVTGTSYGIIGPWSLGVTQVHYAGGYDPEKWMLLLSEQKVTVWYTAPTALRMLMQQPDAFFASFSFPHLKRIYSVGEPLNPEIISWGKRVFGMDIYDTWFQTETGSIMISNHPGLIVKPGSMGKPVDSIEASVHDDKGNPCAPNEKGRLVLKPGWGSMFVNYRNHTDVYREKFVHGWYQTGDTAWIDEEGCFWFGGRSDDVINSAVHLISPFEIESALLEIPQIVESGVVGVPDPMLFEKVVAFIRLKPGVEMDKELELKTRLYLSNKLSSIATPGEIRVVDRIPKNKSGKIMRRVLKASYLGQDIGDISTMEEEE